MIASSRPTCSARHTIRSVRIAVAVCSIACAAFLTGCETEKTRDDIRVDPQRVDPERTDDTLPMHGVEAPKKGWFD